MNGKDFVRALDEVYGLRGCLRSDVIDYIESLFDQQIDKARRHSQPPVLTFKGEEGMYSVEWKADQSGKFLSCRYVVGAT